MESETDFESDLTDGDFEIKRKIDLKIDALKRHRCPFEGCHSAFNRPWKLERHINTHTKNRPFKCNIAGCTKDYTNNSHLQRHISLSHTQNKPAPVFIQCPVPQCMHTFANKWNLKRHYNTHKTAKTYKCQMCDLTFKKHVQLKHHVSIHLGIKPFPCKTCGDSFDSRRDLRRHERKHKIYKCEEDNCHKIFVTFHELRTHTKNAHPIWLKCDFCGKVYKNKYTLTEHIFSHLPKENREVLVCPHEDCERCYLHQRNLDHHIKSFHQNINQQCPICLETFVTKTKLRMHQKLHTEIKEEKKQTEKPKTPRKPRKDKGLRHKSMAAMLSGIKLPSAIDKSLAQNNITPEVSEYLCNIKELPVTDQPDDDTCETVNS